MWSSAIKGLLIIGVALLSVLLSLFLRNSRYGMAIRAVSQQMDAAQLMGIPTRKVFIIVMVHQRRPGRFSRAFSLLSFF